MICDRESAEIPESMVHGYLRDARSFRRCFKKSSPREKETTSSQIADWAQSYMRLKSALQGTQWNSEGAAEVEDVEALRLSHLDPVLGPPDDGRTRCNTDVDGSQGVRVEAEKKRDQKSLLHQLEL
jgi:hypothetical protein